MTKTYNTKGNRSNRLVDWSRYDHLLGRVADREIAVLIGCTSAGVRNRRDKLGIIPKHKTHWTSEEATEFQTLRSQGKQRCRRCKQIKSLSEFDKSAKANGREGYNRWCKECRTEYQAKRIRERRAYWLDLAGNECQNCGYKRYSASLDFHHVSGDDKHWSPGKLIMSRSLASPDVYVELDKCVLLCSNCHQAIHRGQLQLTFQKRAGLGWTVMN